MDATAADPDGTERGSRRLRLLLLVVLLPAVVGALAVGVVMVGHHTSAFGGVPPSWASNLGAVLRILGLLIAATTALWAAGTGQIGALRNSPLVTLSWSHRWRLGRQVRRGIPEAGEDLSLLWHTARQLAGQRWQAVVLAGTAMWVVGQALQQFASVWAVLGGLMAAVGAVGVPLVFWEVHRAEAYLRDHPDPTGR